VDLLVVYADSRRQLYADLEKHLSTEGMAHRALRLPLHWDLNESAALLTRLQQHSHFLFLVGDDQNRHPLLVFCVGYCLSLAERTYVLAPLSAEDSGGWESQFPVSTSLEALMERLRAETLVWAARLEREAAHHQLIEQGFEVTNSAFWETVERGDTGSVELFLKAGFSANSTNKKGVTMLCLSVRFSHFAVLRLLLAWGGDINRKSADRDNTPLMDASAEGHVEMVQELVDRGADLAGQSRNGQNALVLAIGKGADAVAKVLLAAGSDPFAEDKLGMSAQKYAQLFGRKEILELMNQMRPEPANS